VTGARPTAPSLALRHPPHGLRELPWGEPLEGWHASAAPLVELNVGPSRHLVRFVAVADEVYAVKQLPRRLAVHEDAVLVRLGATVLPCVRPGGYVLLPGDDALLVTRYLTDSWQLRAALARVGAEHRHALLGLMLDLLVEAHGIGLLWGDCSLANTLLRRDGRQLRAYLVDVETSELQDRLTDGQREQDVGIAVENTAGALLDLAAAAGRGRDTEALLREAVALGDRYDRRWQGRTALAKHRSAGQDGAIRTGGMTARATQALVALGPDLARLTPGGR